MKNVYSLLLKVFYLFLLSDLWNPRRSMRSRDTPPPNRNLEAKTVEPLSLFQSYIAYFLPEVIAARHV